MSHPIQTLRRRGMSLPELVVACAIAAMTLAGMTQILHRATRQYQVLRIRNVVALEAANLMEDLMSRPWDEVADNQAPAIELSRACLQAAPDARCEVAIAEDADNPAVRRITIRIFWTAVGAKHPQPIQLVAWRYAPATANVGK